MGKLHELLAVEKTRTSQLAKLIQETLAKFKKIDYFQGHVKTLKMIEDSAKSKALEDSVKEERALPTTVYETLEYVFNQWNITEDVLFQKNLTNQSATGNIVFRGEVLAERVPVDELLGLESRLETIRRVVEEIPTLPASVNWQSNDSVSGRKGSWKAAELEVTVKTEKVTTPVVLYAATDKHPAQVEKVVNDVPVGTFNVIKFMGAATSAQKAEMLSVIDDLLAETKQARMRANNVDVVPASIGKKITDLILKPLMK